MDDNRVIASPWSTSDVIKTADVLRLRSSMDEVHDPAYLLAKYRDAVPARLKVDTLVGRGVSGALAVAHLSRDLGMYGLVVRKDIGQHHAAFPAEGFLGRNWLFVDDLIASGDTLRATYNIVQGFKGFSTTFKGAFLYNDGGYRPAAILNHYIQQSKESAW